MFRALSKVAGGSMRAVSRQGAFTSQVRLMSGAKVESDAEFDARYIAYFDRKDIDGWEIRKVVYEQAALNHFYAIVNQWFSGNGWSCCHGSCPRTNYPGSCPQSVSPCQWLLFDNKNSGDHKGQVWWQGSWVLALHHAGSHCIVMTKWLIVWFKGWLFTECSSWWNSLTFQELKPTLDELGIATPEELGYDKPELALPNPYEIH